MFNLVHVSSSRSTNRSFYSWYLSRYMFHRFCFICFNTFFSKTSSFLSSDCVSVHVSDPYIRTSCIKVVESAFSFFDIYLTSGVLRIRNTLSLPSISFDFCCYIVGVYYLPVKIHEIWYTFNIISSILIFPMSLLATCIYFFGVYL